MVTLADDDGIFCIQVAQTGKSRAEHRMCRHITETAFFVEFFQSGLYRSDVADDAVFGSTQHLPESFRVYFTVAALITSSGSNCHDFFFLFS